MRTLQQCGSLLLLAGVCLTGACAPTDSTGDQVVSMMSDAPVDAVVRSMQVVPGETREGMRLVRATVELSGATPQQVTITEWVPIVLLGRLAVGASVQLIRDPAQDRLTIAL